MKLTPLADRVVLKTLEAEETTKGGIILFKICHHAPIAGLFPPYCVMDSATGASSARAE